MWNSANYVEAVAPNHSLNENVYHYGSIYHPPWLLSLQPHPLERELPEAGVVHFKSAQDHPQKLNGFLFWGPSPSVVHFHAWIFKT